ncbi:hypothetical protein SAMN06265365_14839 [Tistlia consotensis]|uniref:Mu-like prophage FluMu N-terminal domain-containing protein n=1 Tax=Tistlia consotensis USBA 355 TaxID=560819 RepID=A0A1Y6CX90_9PROT|nr:HI1506-related protein [Tistlia consotensis]SMF83029.1 hypothetical protein SAMN05428998_14840 [Tistlia consotensis USBA 355]SNS31841.1 hypothetical protein SAMN06265365_14839 [Tistlia consotensis]
MSKLKVISKVAGFRRAGRAWSTEGETVDTSDFTEEQLEALKAEPKLIVFEVPAEPKAEGGKETGGKAAKGGKESAASN